MGCPQTGPIAEAPGRLPAEHDTDLATDYTDWAAPQSPAWAWGAGWRGDGPNPPAPFPLREGGAWLPSPRRGGVGGARNLTPRPPSLRGKRERGSPLRNGEGLGEGLAGR